MFDLEKAISAWRRPFEQDDAFLQDDLEELEAHLRDHIDARIAAGSSEQEAFQAAVGRIGGYGEIETEYRKVRWTRLKRQGSFWQGSLTGWSMIKSYLTISLRGLRRQKGYTFINLSGLSIGIASCLLLFLFVREELSYDTFHDKADRIYRVYLEREHQEKPVATTTELAGPALKASFPEVEAFVRISGRPDSEVLVRIAAQRMYVRGFISADPSFFDVFSFQFIHGDPATALQAPNSVVVSRQVAEKYFSGENPVGKTLMGGNDDERIITGVVENVPSNSQIQFDFVAHRREQGHQFWSRFSGYTYIVLKEGASAEALEEKMVPFVASLNLAQHEGRFDIKLMPLKSLYLRSDFDSEIGATGDLKYLYIFSIAALLILMLASINFVNLSTARSSHRMREVGMRKVLGAERRQLIFQFLGESVVMCLLAFLFALFLIELVLPVFNNVTGKQIAQLQWLDIRILSLSAGFVLLVGLAAGAYGAFFLSSFRPLNVLKAASGSPTRARLRKGLVVSQFSIAILLMVGTMVISAQLRYLQHKNLGFDKENVLIIDRANPIHDQFDAFRHVLLQHAGIGHVSAGAMPRWLGHRVLLPDDDGNMTLVNFKPVDFAYFETMGIELLEGSIQKDLNRPAYVLTESAVRRLKLERAAGQPMIMSGQELGIVMGVVADFHIHSLHKEAEPVVFEVSEMVPYLGQIVVRLHPGDVRGSLDYIERQWTSFMPERPIMYFFLDEKLNSEYLAEERLAMIFSGFASLAILIACLGLFGLAAFAAEQRTKEIGIRKVLGASVASIVRMLSRDFAKLVMVSVFVAAPVAYYLLDRWLEEFPYRIEMGWWFIAAAGGLALGVALLTVSYQAVRAAVADPVRALRCE